MFGTGKGKLQGQVAASRCETDESNAFFGYHCNKFIKKKDKICFILSVKFEFNIQMLTFINLIDLILEKIMVSHDEKRV